MYLFLAKMKCSVYMNRYNKKILIKQNMHTHTFFRWQGNKKERGYFQVDLLKCPM